MKLHKWDDVAAEGTTPEKREEIRTAARAEVLAMRLRALRKAKGLTQAEVAEAAGMAQGELPRMERRGDWRLSTLRRVAKALGGELHVSIALDGEEVPLEGASVDEDNAHA